MAPLTDRPADVWEPLFAVADLAGEPWPTEMRRAALGMRSSAGGSTQSHGVALLADCRRVFQESNADRLSSAQLVVALVVMDEAPWGDLRGQPINPRTLARMLRLYEVCPRKIRLGADTCQGYTAEAFHDAWRRYLPEPEHPERTEREL
jgi:hypothetical protein